MYIFIPSIKQVSCDCVCHDPYLQSDLANQELDGGNQSHPHPQYHPRNDNQHNCMMLPTSGLFFLRDATGRKQYLKIIPR